MKKSDLKNFWIGLFGAAILSFLLYRLLRPRTMITPKPLVVKQSDLPPFKKATKPQVRKDSLVKIRGIGPVTEKSLNDEGIVSFAQLANASPSDIEKYTGKRYDPKDWIEQAAELASQQL